MKLRKSFGFVLLSVLFSFTQCSDDDNLKPETKGVAVKKADAVVCTDLSNKSDWMLLIGGDWNSQNGISYNFSVENKNITAHSPKNAFYTFKEEYAEGDLLVPDDYTYIRFVSPNYYSETNIMPSYAAERPRPVIHDQSSFEKLTKADILFCRYMGVVAEHLTDINLIHGNVLLDFETINIPPGAEIKIQGGVAGLITPYQENESHYKAIALSLLSTLSQNEIILFYGNEQVSVKTNFILADTHYRFTLRFDEQKKELIIENLIQTVWSEEEDPFKDSGLDLIGITHIIGGTLNGSEGIEKSNRVITNATDWQELMAKMNSVNDLTEHFKETEIDFERYIVIAIFLEMKTSGWKVEINEIKESNNHITVSTKEQAYSTTVITQPFHIVKIPKTNKEIIFK